MSGSIFGASPYNTSSVYGSFSPYTDGVIQGTAYADAAASNYLASGVIAAGQLPLYGGIPVSNSVNLSPFSANRNGLLTRATSAAGVTGIAVFDQAHQGVIRPGVSDVPLYYPGMDINYYRMGSNARIIVKASADLAALGDEAITSQVSWDFATGTLQPYTAGASAIATSSFDIAAATSGYTVMVTTASAHGLATGDYATIAGVTPDGYNGTFPVTVTSTTTFTYALATNPGAVTAQGTVSADGGAFNCRVLEVLTSNCKTVDLNATAGTVTWNTNDAAAIILI